MGGSFDFPQAKYHDYLQTQIGNPDGATGGGGHLRSAVQIWVFFGVRVTLVGVGLEVSQKETKHSGGFL